VSQDPLESTSFEALASSNLAGLFRFLYWWTGHRADAEDALQEVLIRAHRGFAKLRDHEKFKSWIFKIAANVGRDTAQKQRRAMPTFGVKAFDDSEPVLLHSGEPTPFARLQTIEADRRLAEALASLPAELREPLVLHTLSGMKYREIAEALGWPIGTVTTRIHVARERLARLLGED
jgi:RNA polymerase sigma-70 factor (ECF subfamily)